MIGYVTLGTNDLEKAASFYDQLLAEIGASRLMEMEKFIAWGTEQGAPMLAAIKPFNDEPATVGNGVMVSLFMENTDKVDSLHKKALELGSQDEGAPGPRGDEGFYGGYFRDLDGNKLCAFHISPPG
jgi:predicted lactoylglutathione lyase